MTSDDILPVDLSVNEEKLLAWETECWQCGEDTAVVWPKEDHLDSLIGAFLADHDTPVERVYSDTLEKDVWGNVCQHCGSYQGNHFVEEEALEISPPSVECPNCGEIHEWRPDEGMGRAFDQGWVSCPEYGGDIPVDDPRK